MAQEGQKWKKVIIDSHVGPKFGLKKSFFGKMAFPGPNLVFFRSQQNCNLSHMFYLLHLLVGRTSSVLSRGKEWVWNVSQGARPLIFTTHRPKLCCRVQKIAAWPVAKNKLHFIGLLFRSWEHCTSDKLTDPSMNWKCKVSKGYFGREGIIVKSDPLSILTFG